MQGTVFRPKRVAAASLPWPAMIPSELDKTDLKRSTKESYKFLVAKHIVPAFGNEKIDALDYRPLKAWVIAQAGKYSKDTIRLMVAACGRCSRKR